MTFPNSNWHTDGCNTTLLNNSLVKCECNHMTPFSVLMQVKSFQVIILFYYFVLFMLLPSRHNEF